MVNRKRHIIRTLFLLLFFLCSMGNEASAKVTYHILTLPFDTYKDDHTTKGTYIVEALRCTDNNLTVELPEHFKSPLVIPGSFRYYAEDKVTKSATRSQIYHYITTTYDTYTIPDVADSLTTGSTIPDGSHIYVTYRYDNATSPIKLDGSKDYNILLGDRFLCFNKARNNRFGAILKGNVTEENLVSEDFTYVTKCGFDNNAHYFHFRFYYEGNDPYNITIRTSYRGDETFMEGDKALSKTVKKWYKGSSLFCQGKDNGANNLWLASDDDYQYTQTDANGEVTFNYKPGFYRGGNGGTSEMNPIFNSVAILNAADGSGSYVYIGTKINTNGNNWQPNSNGQYLYLTGNIESGKNPRFQLKTYNNAEQSTPYPIDKFTFKVKTPLSNRELSVDVYLSNYNKNASLLTHIPEAIKRKYATFTGTYKEAALTNEINTFEDALSNEKVIWLKYTSSLPFETLPIGGCYDDARWYTIRMNGHQENQYVTYLDNTSGTFYTGRGSNAADKLHQGENSAEAMVAFIGDPFELKIISRKASETATETAGGVETAAHNRYIGCTGASTPMSLTTGASLAKDAWEIVYEDTQMGTMILREMGTATAETPRYIGWDYAGSNRPMIYSTTETRMKVVELEKKNYVYHIVRADGSIAVKATEAQDVGKRLKYVNIPEIIRSPLISPTYGTVAFFDTKSDADAGTNATRHASYDADLPNAGDHVDIYVRYTSTNSLTKNYHVRLNGQYIYHSEGNINSQAETGAADNTAHQWYLDLVDPYAMSIKNVDAGFVKVDAWANDKALSWEATEANASRFIVKSSTVPGVYEVMAATGDDVDAATTYYNIGRPADNTVRIYANSVYPHGYNQIRFLLTPTDATATDYHLIDKSNKVLVVVRSMVQELGFPDDYYSPLVETYHYWKDATLKDPLTDLGTASEVEGIRQVYVTYTTSNRVDLQKGTMYLLKFEEGDNFKQENGSDKLLTDAELANPHISKAVYPYCNGDCNFFVYGQYQFDLQQEGAASTRTRWAWYLESANNDPYHVKICSRQQETFNNAQNQGYFRTYTESYGNSDHVVTNLAWPGITGEQGTEYMILGALGQYQLITSPVDSNNDNDYDDPGERVFNTVKSFEQYWKTFDTVRKNIFGDPAKTISPDDPSTVPATPLYAVTTAAELTSNRDYLEQVKNFHHYSHWAYAKRWNGYNISGAKSKGWEDIEHWYQTVNMGEGYFNFEEIVIEPALILLDQHGWEIMRKPLPSSPDDPTKAAKYEALQAYDSPMVKEYIFWSSAKKRTGLHQYYLMDKRIGGDFTSTTLTNLPPYDSENVLDAKGNLNDQYVTYIVKDEYAMSYHPSYPNTGAQFLIQQGDKFAYNNGTTAIGIENVPEGGMSQYIIENIGTIYQPSPTAPALGTKALWFVKPNTDIDTDMGYGTVAHDWGTSTPNAYDDAPYSTNRTSVILEGSSSDATIKKYGRFSFSNGFDPYNIQITSVSDPTQCFVTNATGGILDNGQLDGTYSDIPAVTLGTATSDVGITWYDGARLNVNNTTFMAVQDKDGNMQLMPRFDHLRRIGNFSTVDTPVEQVGDDDKLKKMQTQLFRPLVYNYRIIDNEGHESIRYRSAGELRAQMPDHFKSPLAKDITYYTDLTLTEGIYTEVATNADISSKEITGSLASDNHLTYTNSDGNVIYVRYKYNEEADATHLLKGKWFTMQLNEKDAVYDNGIKEGTSKPTPIDATQKAWQWKFLETPQTTPDPYAICLYNRHQAEGTKAINKRFALLSHTSGNYALAEAGTEDYTYKFLNGNSMNASTAATIVTEADFTGTANIFSGTDSQVKLIDDVVHTYIYKVYTNDDPNNPLHEGKYGVWAISDEQSQAEASINEFVPTIPDAIMTPLLNVEDFLYYEKETYMGDVTKELKDLYGLYDDEVYVRYKPYNENNTTFRVPNDKAIVGSHAARGTSSNDTSLGLNGNLLYNIVWYNDNTMKRNGNDITCQSGLGTTLKSEMDYEWKLEGGDPYAIKVKDMSDNYVYNSSSNSCSLSSTNATTFMLLKKDGHDYGIMQVTGDTNGRKWSGNGNTLTSNASTDPTHYVIYALATHKVIYHLRIATTNTDISIPYRVAKGDGELTTKTHPGSTQRDLTSTTGASGTVAGDKYQLGTTISLGSPAVKTTYCYDAGCISLGYKLKVPSVFDRPNVNYHFFVEGVFNDDACTNPVTDMDNLYKGLEIENMGDETGLLGKTVLINILYSFNQTLDTNNGLDFVRNVDNDKRWYTFETIRNGNPWLAQFTNALGGFEVKEGRGSHYTNDYLWSPLGDPYGFKMYNRYIFKNSGMPLNNGEKNRVMTTTEYAEGQAVTLGNNLAPGDTGYIPDPKNVYELLPANTDGYFRVHPVDNKTGTQYYLRTVPDVEGVYVKLSTVASEWTFGLSEELVKPYYDRAGYVGGLTAAGKELYESAGDNLIEKQQIVYSDENLEPFTPGYYRLHSPNDIKGIMEERYASGYTHELEKTAGGGVPMHFYEKAGTSTTFALLRSKDGQRTNEGFTVSDATRGDLPIPDAAYDPASIFYITGTYDDAIMSTQGLYVKGEKNKDQDEADGERAKAVMTDIPGDAMHLWIMDIGGTVMLIHDQNAPGTRKYFSYDQTEDAHIYDLKMTHHTHTDHAKWCLQPVNNLGLLIATHSGGDEGTYGTSYNYASTYLPFDILLPDKVQKADESHERIYQAFILDDENSPWDPENDDLHPKSIGHYNTGIYAENGRFVPAGTPVLLAMWDQSDYVKVTLPNTSPSASLLNSITYTNGEASPVSCNNILTGEYLEQKLSAGNDIYVFGMPINAKSIDKADDYATTGNIDAVLPSLANAGIGFYLNANLDKETGISRDQWTRNNWYVLGNKVYYRTPSGNGASQRKMMLEYVPVDFGGEDMEEEDEDTMNRQREGDGRVYDMQGRCVATEQQVKDGTWRDRLSAGIYIVNGRKVRIQ